MTHHEEEVKSVDYIYYLIGLFCGLFVGCILGCHPIYIPALGIFGLLFAGFFLKVFVKGREGA